MKKIFTLFLLLPFLLAGSENKNLLRNGDFSQGLKFWYPREKSGISILPKAGPGGKNVLQAIKGEKDIYIANYFRNFKPNTNYTLRGWIRNEGDSQLYLYFCQSPNAAKFHSKSQTLRGPGNWTKVYALLNSGNAKSLAVLLRAVGKQTAKVYFSGLEVLEGNHLPKENLFANSDFKKKTRYEKIPDCWTPALYLSIADTNDYVFELAPEEKAPVEGAQVLRVRKAIVHGQKIQDLVPGLTYTYSFYARNKDKKIPAVILLQLGSQRKTVTLTEEWKRYSITGKVHGTHAASRIVPVPKKYGEFLFSAPQLVVGSEPVEWTAPVPRKNLAVGIIREAIARADSRLISGTPKEADWKNAPTYELIHLSRGKEEGKVYSHARILHNKTHIFVLFTFKKDPAIKVGDTTRLNWSSLCDTAELFITDRAGDGTYIHSAININSHSYSARNTRQEVLGIQSKVMNKKDEWNALFQVPLSLFHSNKEWKIAFCRGYDHKEYGRIAMDWSLAGSRHKTENFGLLYGVNVEKREVLDLIKLYAGKDNKNIHYQFSAVPEEIKGASITASLLLRGKTLWQKSMPFTGSKGSITLPGNYEKMTETGTRFSLKVTGKNGEELFLGSRVFYLLFSSYAKYNKDMELYPKYNIFTPRDKNVILKSNLNRKIFDNLRFEIRDEKGKIIAEGKGEESVLIPVNRFAVGKYRIYAFGMKNGKAAESRNHFTFRVLPYFEHMVRINYEQAILETPHKPILPMAYYGVSSPYFAYDPLISRMPSEFFAGVKKAHFTGIKTGPSFIRTDKGRNFERVLEECRKNDIRILLDMEVLFPRGYYSHSKEATNLSSEEAERIMIQTTTSSLAKFAGKPGILAYAPYHEPGYFRNGKGIVDSYRVPRILDSLRKEDPYRPITGFWAPPHWDTNGEPFGSIDGVDFFIVDVYTRDLEKHCDELFRIANASKTVRKPIGQIFNIDNLGYEDRDAPTAAEYKAELYTALIAGYRVFYNYVGLPADKALWKSMQNCNLQLKTFVRYLGDDSCRELLSVNGAKAAYGVFSTDKEILVIAASKSNDKKVNFSIDLEKIAGHPLKNGKELFGNQKMILEKGLLKYTFPIAGSNAWIFQK